MKPFRARYTPEAAALIRKLHPDGKKRIREGIRSLLVTPSSGGELRLDLSGYRSFRIRDYRVIYQLNEERKTVDVVYVGPRKDVYENFLAYLRGLRS